MRSASGIGARHAAAPMLALLLLTGCAAGTAGADAGSDSSVIEKVPFATVGDEQLLLDACLPDSEVAVPAVVLLHGGGFTEGNRVGGGMRELCVRFASAGFAAFSIDYRLVPETVFPGQVDDVRSAITWLRQPEQVERFSIDADRIGVLGSSAGAILAQEVGTSGDGPLDDGTRVAAVASLSGVSLMTEEALTLGTPSEDAIDMILAYLDCESPAVDVCPQSAEASAALHVDPTDPPMLLVNGRDELVPAEQAQAMQAALESAGVESDVIIGRTGAHGVALLSPDVSDEVLAFFDEALR
ncbi:alpha/beta hydrolase fold domain-containing protein [Agromyces sp. Marseille-Q5079]|uniref:alpha/beta hydrolase fold domain-containing protein n=1 Tax=Agromyces sp. Marseille-Q5079 TaxID=3439059 RepID=UPI003D9C96C5